MIGFSATGVLVSLIGILALVGMPGPGLAQETGDIAGIDKKHRQLGHMLEELARQRGELAAGADSLASKIDSLKVEAPESTDLHDALRASMVLVQQLTAIDQRSEALALRREELLDQLRLAYDWRIGQLFQRLEQESSPQLLQRLAQMQRAREALGERIAAGQLRYGDEMAIGQDDGPEQIRFKIDLMEDMATRLATESDRLQARQRRLEEERRLRTRMNAFTGQLSLFDEHLPQGRVLRRGDAETGAITAGYDESRSAGMDVAEASFAPGADAPEPAAEAIISQSRLDRSAGGASGREFGPANLLYEMGQLKARRLEIRQLETVLTERITVFRNHLQKLKDGGE
jgi:hypothetical protein